MVKEVSYVRAPVHTLGEESYMKQGKENNTHEVIVDPIIKIDLESIERLDYGLSTKHTGLGVCNSCNNRAIQTCSHWNRTLIDASS